MKYSIPQERLDKLVFRYLDIKYGNLEKVKGEFVNIVFKKPNSDSGYGIMGYDKNLKKLYIYYKLVKEISDIFSLEEIDSQKVIGRWVEDRHKIEVIDTLPSPAGNTFAVEDRHQIEVK